MTSKILSSPPAKDHAANQYFKHSNTAFITLNVITMVSLHLLAMIGIGE